MNPYEITFIVRPDIDDDATRGVVDTVRRRIESSGGEILAAFPWGPGRRRLAYPINDFGDGYYYTIDFNFEPQGVREFENGLRLNDSLLRFLVVTATDLMVKNSQQRVQQQAQQAAQAAAQAQAAAAAPVPAQVSGPAPDAEGGSPSAASEPSEPAPQEQPTAEGASTQTASAEPQAAQVDTEMAQPTAQSEPSVEPEMMVVVDDAVATDPGLPAAEAPLPPVIVAEPASPDVIATLPEDEIVPAGAPPAPEAE